VRKASISSRTPTNHAHEPVGHLLIALDLVGKRHQHLHVVEVEDRALGEEFLGDDFVGLLALGRIARGARDGVRRVDLLIAELAVVLRRVAGLEDERIAVGIAAPAPAVQIELVVAVVALLERSRELGDPDLEVEARFRRHRLHDLGDGAVLGAIGHHEVQRERRGHAGLLQ
jgi:hypothetical protein